MHVKFVYDIQRDAWCVRAWGAGSYNSAATTEQYELLKAVYGESPSQEDAEGFVAQYIATHEISVQERATQFQSQWNAVEAEFSKRAEHIFGIILPEDVTAYLTINARCPYRVEESYFFVTITVSSPIRVAMHELWHFYTWYRFKDSYAQLGAQRYNDLKESLTVLLNSECGDLLPADTMDHGYPQHAVLRSEAIRFWETDKNIEALWGRLMAI